MRWHATCGLRAAEQSKLPSLQFWHAYSPSGCRPPHAEIKLPTALEKLPLGFNEHLLCEAASGRGPTRKANFHLVAKPLTSFVRDCSKPHGCSKAFFKTSAAGDKCRMSRAQDYTVAFLMPIGFCIRKHQKPVRNRLHTLYILKWNHMQVSASTALSLVGEPALL